MTKGFCTTRTCSLPHKRDTVAVVESELDEPPREEDGEKVSAAVVVVSIVKEKSVFGLSLDHQDNVVPQWRRIAQPEVGQV